MQFRWVAVIALWTFLAGPAIGPPAASRWAPQPVCAPPTAEFRPGLQRHDTETAARLPRSRASEGLAPGLSWP